MKMEAILAKTVSGRIASVLILYQVDFSSAHENITRKREVYLVLLHLEALSSPKTWVRQATKISAEQLISAEPSN